MFFYWITSDIPQTFTIKVQVIWNTAHRPSTQASYTIASGTTIQENQPAAQIAAKHNIFSCMASYMSWIFLVLVGIDPGVSRLGGEIVSHNTTDALLCFFSNFLVFQMWNVNVIDTILWQSHHDRVIQLDWLYSCGICQMMPLKVWQNTALGCNHQSICMPQLQPLCSAALVPNVLPRRDEGSGRPCAVIEAL